MAALNIDYAGAARNRTRIAAELQKCPHCHKQFRGLADHIRAKHGASPAPPVRPITVEPVVYRNGVPAITQEQASEFYASHEWRVLRYRIIRAAKGQCQACGTRPSGSVYLNVDHIKPLRFFWSLRLDPKNLQCLCSLCNEGKGNWDSTDWRRA